MKIQLHLFCLIGALSASVTDGRIASSSSSVVAPWRWLRTKSPTTKQPTYAPTTKTCLPGYSIYNGECSLCNAGRIGTNGLTCELCSAGTFNSNLGQTECTPCPKDMFSNKVGSASVYNCKFCPQGKTTLDTTGAASEDQCTNCPVNTYGIAKDSLSFTAGCRSCETSYPVNTDYGTTTCGKTGAKSYLGCAFDTPKEENPACTETRGKFYGSINGGPRTTRGCGNHQYCDPNEGDERPQKSPLLDEDGNYTDDNYHSES